MKGDYLNLTGAYLTAQDQILGVYDPGPFTDSAIAGLMRGMTPENARGHAADIAAIAEIDGARGAVIDGPGWRIEALAEALATRGIHVITILDLRTHGSILRGVVRA